MELKFILESLLFSAQKPMSAQELREVLINSAEGSENETVRAFKKIKIPEIHAALEALASDHDAAARSYRLVCIAGSWQFVTQPDFAPWLRTFVGVKNRPSRLSQPALETLAIIAYRQPVTRAEIEQVRGVSVDGVMQTLLERDLIVAAGRAEVVGRPVTYATTPLFLEYFGLKNLEELPAADELRRIPVEKPAALVTADADPNSSATVAPTPAPDAGGTPAAAETQTSAPAAEQQSPAADAGGSQTASAEPAPAPESPAP